jgi:hypothetical protein
VEGILFYLSFFGGSFPKLHLDGKAFVCSLFSFFDVSETPHLHVFIYYELV